MCNHYTKQVCDLNSGVFISSHFSLWMTEFISYKWMVPHRRTKKRCNRKCVRISKKYRSNWISGDSYKKNSMDPSQKGTGDLYVFICIGYWGHTCVSVFNSHVLRNRSVANSVCSSCRDAGLAAVAAAAAVETGHVHPVQVIMILSASRSHGHLLTVLIRPVCTNTHNRNIHC